MSNPPVSAAKPITVTVIDNYPSTRMGVEQLGSAYPDEFRFVGSFDGIGDLDFNQPAPDILVLDLRLGRDDELSTPAIPRLVAWGTRVVVHTSEERPVVLRRAMAAGASGICLKQDGNEGLRRAIHEVMLSGTATSSALASALLDDPTLLAQLTNREVQVLEGVYDGLTRRQIARRMQVAESTVKAHADNATAKYRALGRNVSTTGIAAREARRDGWIDGP